VSAPAWDTERAAELAATAYRYVADTYPRGVGYGPLDALTEAAHEAQDAGDFEAYRESLRELCRVAKREALQRRRGVA
jgi:hypothetical protein